MVPTSGFGVTSFYSSRSWELGTEGSDLQSSEQIPMVLVFWDCLGALGVERQRSICTLVIFMICTLNLVSSKNI